MMEEPVELLRPRVLSPCSSGKRRSCDSNSPEFEFWSMLRNPSFPQPNLHSADELFSDGVLLPLHLLHNHSSDDPPDQNPPEKPTEPETSGSDQPGSGPEISNVLSGLSAPAFTSSKRWKDIFKITDRSSSKEKDKEKKKEKKTGGGGGGGGGGNNNGVSAAELNINIWPFRRSRSAGNGGSRPRMAAAGATRKVSSAPCSRSNSAGESKSRKWPSSPSRGGVHVGRTSPVWQVRRGAGGSGGGKGGAGDVVARNAVKGIKKDVNEVRRKKSVATVSGGGAAGGGGAKGKVLHLNVPMCIGYRHHLSCRSDENGGVSVVTEAAVVGGSGGGGFGGVHRGGPGGADEGVRGSSSFNIRSLFTKKVH